MNGDMRFKATVNRRDGATTATRRALGVLTAAILTAFGAAQAADLTGDPAIGAKLFLQCRACHTVGASDASGVGPNLYGVVGAKAASKAGFQYSSGLSAAGIVWTPATLDAWIQKPTAVVPTTKMAFQGVSDPQMRANLIAYLATLQPKPGAK